MIFKFLKSSYQKVSKALSKTRHLLGDKIRSIFSTSINQESLDQLEEILYEADLGVVFASELTEKTRQHLKTHPKLTTDELITFLEQEILKTFPETKEEVTQASPHVILIVGVNGNGKTTATAKIANQYKLAGKKVLVGAADTFRAAALEQLQIWAQRLGIEIVKGAPKGDPAAVAFDAVTAAKSREMDVVIIDTAGRLHVKTALMHELEKIRRSCQKVAPGSPHEILLVLDATTGQNAIDQAKTFQKFVPLTGLILTKLDGTAKGGIALSIQKELRLPIKFITIGESIEDIEPFEPEAFVSSLFETRLT